MTDLDDEVGDLHLATVVVNVTDMERGVRFWEAALGYRQRERRWDPEFMMLIDPTGNGMPVSLQLADSESADPASIHMDLYTEEQDKHVARLVALGATQADDWDYPEDADFIVLRDPDGNEFCIIDHAPL